ncbi:MAG: CDP-alcohol phosphatidyltransferase family protein [Betaproteobacteria bacterium]
MLNLPNAITVVRALLIPAIGGLLVVRDYHSALVLFLLCALGDLLDGWLARRLDQRSRFGAIADPLADKLTMLTVALLLAWHGLLPWWFAALVVLRDATIVAGAAAYHFTVERVEMAPTRLSKLNTALEFVLLAAVLAQAAGWFAAPAALAGAVLLTTATIVASGVHYVVSWSVKARRARSATIRRR